jgi:A/G-specific adenine glycosylase
LHWFRKNKRNLPWRKETHWYPIFLSEILLQQTQVEQALPYYVKFINRFPDIHSLSKVSEQEVLSLWAGLGYYSRARNLLKAAKIIVADFNAEFPDNFKQALSLPGIGKYTASAILSIAYKRPHAVVDGNVHRVTSRLFAISEDVRLTSTQKEIQEICNQLISINKPGEYNEAIMELGATICKKQNPDCINCPVKSFCVAFNKNKQAMFPYRSAAPEKRKVNHYVFIIENNKKYLLAKRPFSGLLASLWEFPVIEMKKLYLNNEQLETLLIEKYAIRGKIILKGDHYRHQYSHIDLTYQPVLIKKETDKIKVFENYVDITWCTINSLIELPIHNAHLKLIQWLKNLNR